MRRERDSRGRFIRSRSLIPRTPLVSPRPRANTPPTQTHIPSFTDPRLPENLRSDIPLERPSTLSIEPVIEEDSGTPARDIKFPTSTEESTMVEEGGGGVFNGEHTIFGGVEVEVEDKEVEVQKEKEVEEEVEEKWEALLGSL